MCAIASIVQNEPTSTKLFRTIIRSAVPFGKHSIGMAYPVRRGIKVWKRAVHPELALYNNTRRFALAQLSSTVLTHCRHATVGVISDRTAHPFAHIKEDGTPVVFAHNGTVRNYATFGNYTVDSECLGPMIEQRDLLKAEGSVGLVWIDSDGLHAYRNNNQSLFAMHLRRGEASVTAILSKVAQGDRVADCAIKEGYVVSVSDLIAGVAYRVKSDAVEGVWASKPVQTPVTASSIVRRHKLSQVEGWAACCASAAPKPVLSMPRMA